MSDDTIIKIQSENIIPSCERNINIMYSMTLVSSVNSKYAVIRWCVPILINAIMLSSTFSLLFYPEYYPTQGVVWTFDLSIGFIAYNYLLYLFTQWETSSCFEHVALKKYVDVISLTFFVLYMIYWLYFTIIQFSNHNAPSILIQFGNLLMSASWYFFFSTISVTYYFICVKLSQRATSICTWLHGLRDLKPSVEDFYSQYNEHYKQTIKLSGYWNLLILIGLLLQTCHIPIDLISVVYNKYYFDIFGLIVKTLSLLWYFLRICDLNESEDALISYLYEHRIYSFDIINDIKIYTAYRPLGLDFYGIKLNKSFLIKLLLVGVNLLLPTLYALVSSKIFG